MAAAAAGGWGWMGGGNAGPTTHNGNAAGDRPYGLRPRDSYAVADRPESGYLTSREFLLLCRHPPPPCRGSHHIVPRRSGAPKPSGTQGRGWRPLAPLRLAAIKLRDKLTLNFLTRRFRKQPLLPLYFPLAGSSSLPRPSTHRRTPLLGCHREATLCCARVMLTRCFR
jgi:hypothetical protein